MWGSGVHSSDRISMYNRNLTVESFRTYLVSINFNGLSTEEDGRKLKNIYIDLILKKIVVLVLIEQFVIFVISNCRKVCTAI